VARAARAGLRAFAKVELAPGDPHRALHARRASACWDPSKSGWVAEPGEFELRAARRRATSARARFTLGGAQLRACSPAWAPARVRRARAAAR
jgi:hypothetical protein